MVKPKKQAPLQVRAPKGGPGALDAFVRGEEAPAPPAAGDRRPAAKPQEAASSVQKSNVDFSPPPETPKIRGIVPRARGEQRAQVTVYLRPEEAARLKEYCFRRGLRISDVAGEVVTEFISKLP